MMRIKNKKAQSMVEMCICIPIFMVCIFGAFDLTMMISALMDTMVVARDTLREMSLIKDRNPTNVKQNTIKVARNLAARADNGNGFLSFNISRSNGNDNELNVQNGPSVHNSPHLVQICSHVSPIVPWMWGLKRGEDLKVCSSYYMLRQFQPPNH